MKKWFWIVLVLMVAGSCLDEPDCLDLNNAYVGISFKKMFDGKADTVALVGIYSQASDSIFYPFSLATDIQLPLNQFASQTEYLFDKAYDIDNSLVLTYENNPVEFIAEDCGNRYVLSSLEVASHDFDSLKIISNVLSAAPEKNIEVYRCPRTNQAKVAFRQRVSEVEKADTVYLESLVTDFPSSFFIPANDTLSYIYLPLNPDKASTQYSFGFKDGSGYSITFSYVRTAWNQFENACGTLTLFSELSAVHDFSEVRITKDSIQDPPTTNVAIFK